MPELANQATSAEQRQYERIKEERELTQTLFEAGNPQDLPSIRGTLWSAYNVVTWFADFLKSRPVALRPIDPTEIWNGYSGLDLNKRLTRIWFGDASHLKNHAYNKAYELASKL